MSVPIARERIHVLNNNPIQHNGKYVLYWMQTAVRVAYNYALDYAIHRAIHSEKPLLICFGLTESFPEANARHYAFLLQGLLDVQKQLERRNLQLVVWKYSPEKLVEKLSKEATETISDTCYLRHVAEHIPCRFTQIETECIVPVELTSDKEEFAARTIRPKLWKHAKAFLIPWSDSHPSVRSLVDIPKIDDASIFLLDGDPKLLVNKLQVDKSVKPVDDFIGGEMEAKARLTEFCEQKLKSYSKLRNDPSLQHISHLSPYLHFGHISPVDIVLSANESSAPKESKDAFIEEVFIRRELSFNFCHFCPSYDSYESIPEWAKKTLDEHRDDKRQYLYSSEQLEGALTHDPYWNAAQLEMIRTGKMHNYMRMYWGKKVIEWTKTPKEAFRILIYLNNKYELDGRDPNSFTGVAWCFGKHDRAHAERPITGKLRYMSSEGLKRKFAIAQYVERYNHQQRTTEWKEKNKRKREDD
eukprot:jgi/Galph1/4546/GphlegSOOS_G3149.1